MTVEDELRTRFARSVESVVPGPEPYQRLLRRRRHGTVRRTAVGAAGLAAVLVAAVLVLPHVATGTGTDGVAGPRPTGHAALNDGQPIASDWVRRLIATPTRGTLDAGYVRGLAATARGELPALEVAPDLSDVSVLFAGDVGAARVALVAFHSDSRALTYWYVGTRGASARALLARPYMSSGSFANSGVAGLDSEYTLTWSGRPSVHLDALIGLVPAGCAIMTASDRAHQNWTSEPTVDYLVRTQARTADWWKITCAGTVRYVGPAQTAIGAWSYDDPLAPAQLDAAIAGARGTVDRNAASTAVSGLSHSTMVTTGPPRVLWGGPLPGPNGVTSPAALAAAPVPGGWLTSVWWQPGGPHSIPPSGPPAPGDAPPPPSVGTTDVNLGDPGVLFAARAVYNSPLVLVFGPRSATTVTADVGGRQVARATLTDGVGWVNVAGSGPVTVRAMDGGGRLVGTYVLGHHADDPDPNPTPSISNW